MKRTTKAIVVVGVTIGSVAAVASTVALAGAASDDDGTEVPITGASLDRATTVALDHLGEGRVTETEEGDEDSYYEVEVTLDNGNEVDVQLDREFNVVGAEPESRPDDG